MKRSPMPARTTPLRSRTRLTGRTPFRRRSRTGLSPRIRTVVLLRSRGMCEGCGGRLPVPGWHAHHRKLRSQGGQDTSSNLLALHLDCHANVHANPAGSLRSGLIVSREHQPAGVAVHVFGCGWVLLDDEGGRTACPEAGGAA